MEKRKIIYIYLIVFISVFISISNVFAFIGVSPGHYEIDFSPNYKEEFKFKFMTNSDTKLEIYIDGDLAEYADVDKKILDEGGGEITAYIKLPEVIEKPGTHKIGFNARVYSGGGNINGIGIVGEVRGYVLVKVPYPGKYIESKLQTTNANMGEPVNITLSLENKGKEDLWVDSYLEIYNEERTIENIYLGKNFIESTKSLEIPYRLDTEKYKPGDYNITAKIDFGGDSPQMIPGKFRLGRLYVQLVNYTSEFERDKINRLDIQVESFWNDPIKNVFAEVQIIDYSINIKTPSISLDPWKLDMLVGFFDTSTIKEDEFRANVTIHYGEEGSNSQIINLRLKKKVNYLIISLIGSLALIIIILISILIILVIKTKNSKKYGIEEKKK